MAIQRTLLPASMAAVGRQPEDQERALPAVYDPELFVIPGPAYQRVLDKLRIWQGMVRNDTDQPGHESVAQYSPRPTSMDQVLRVAGEHGVGKTWLLRYLAEDEELVAPVALYLDLLKRKESGEPEDFVRAVQHQIDTRCGTRAAVLLLDAVPPHLDEHLRLLEDLILRPHLSQRGSMVIMALSHPSHDGWRAATLRGGETLLLQPFGQPETRNQLSRLEETGKARVQLRAAAVQDRSGGLPLLNCLFSQYGQGLAFELLLEYVFAQIPVNHRATVRSYLEAVCVLESLEHASIESALQVYHHGEYGTGSPLPHAGQVLNALRAYWLAQASPGAPGRIVLVECVRRAAREALQASAPSLYVAMNEATYGARGGER